MSAKLQQVQHVSHFTYKSQLSYCQLSLHLNIFQHDFMYYHCSTMWCAIYAN